MEYLRDKRTKEISCVIGNGWFFQTRERKNFETASYGEYQAQEKKKSSHYIIQQLKDDLLTAEGLNKDYRETVHSKNRSIELWKEKALKTEDKLHRRNMQIKGLKEKLAKIGLVFDTYSDDASVVIEIGKIFDNGL